jgi:Bacterial membrane protein YfhO
MNKLFTPLRFGILLALLVFAAFPHVILGLGTFVARDFGFFAYPLAHFQRDCFWRGEIPFWNPYNNCGVPFLAQWNTLPLYPPSLIYLTLPLTWSLSFFCLLHLWFAGLGMFFLARRWTGNNFAAAFAGVVFAFNGFTLNLLMWPSHMATFAWMPWVVLTAELAWREGGQKIFLAAIVGALQMLAGGPETIFLTWLIVGALWLQQFIKNESPRTAMLWRFPLVIVLVIALSAAQLLPFLDLVAHAQRESGFADLRWSMPGRGWVNFLVPMAFGTTHTEGIFFQHDQYWTSSYYLSLGALWLALLALLCVRERRVWLLGGIAIVGLIFALGENTPVLPALRRLIPQLSFITYPIKYISVVIFAAPLLAAFALANFQKVQKRLLPFGAILLALIIAIIFWSRLAPLPGDESQATLLNGVSREAFLLLTGAILFGLTREAKSRLLQLAPLLLLLTAWADVFTHVPTQNPTVTPDVFELNLARTHLQMKPQPELGSSRAMLSPAAANAFVTFAARDPKNNFLAKRAGYCANVNLLDGVPKVDGFFSLTPRESDKVLSLFYRTTNADFPQLENFMGVSQITAPDSVLHWLPRTTFLPLVTAGQKPIFIDDSSMDSPLTNSDFDGGKIVFLPAQSSSLITVSNQTTAKILNSKFGNQTVDAEVEAAEPSLVVVAQTYYYNWRAEIDGQPTPLLRANVAFQAIQVPKGTHKIHLAYVDRAFQIGAAISIAALVGSLIGLIRLPRRKINKDLTNMFSTK